MKPIPIEAMPVVEVLRRDVPRPDESPIEYMYADGALRWMIDGHGCCPMGLHPKSRKHTPGSYFNFADGSCTQVAVKSFWRWWDSLGIEDALEGMDAIWLVAG